MTFRVSKLLRDLAMHFRPRGRRHLARRPRLALVAEILEDRRLLATLTVNSLDDNTNADTVLTLREAIALVNFVSPMDGLGRNLTMEEQAQIDESNMFGVMDEINFENSLSGGTITLSGSDLSIIRSVEINGLGAGLLTIDANDSSRVFNINASLEFGALISVTLTGLTLTGGSSFSDGGAIFSEENLTISGSVISGSTASRGGGIYSNNGTLTISNSAVSANVAFTDGGGIFSIGNLMLMGATISGNDASNSGAGVFQEAPGTASFSNSEITGNTADFEGGGIYNDGAALTLTGANVSGNSALFGGGIENSGGGTVTIDGSTFANNSASLLSGGLGGAIENFGGNVAITNSSFSRNAAKQGGAIANSGLFSIAASSFLQNSSSDSGGAIDNVGTLAVTSSVLAQNTSFFDGGAIASDGTLTLTNSTLSGNSAAGSGGGIDNSGTLTVTNSTITQNTAEIGGGIAALFSETLESTIVAGNEAGMADPDISGSIESGSNNLIGDAASAGGLMDGQSGNIVGNGGSGVIDINTVLDVTLRNNGGLTLTHLLVPGSPAINAGANPNALAFDQRGSGFARVADGQADIGAFETQPRSLVVNDDVNLLVNGGFETGDFTGWVTTSTGAGAWVINDGTLDPASPATPLPPISGDFDAISDTGTGGMQTLRQTFSVPIDITIATLRFTDRIQNFAAFMQCGVQEFRVVLQDSGGTEIQEVFFTHPGFIPTIQPTFRELDVTAALQSVAGETAELVFIVNHSAGPLNVSLDDVSLIVGNGFSNVQDAINTANPGDTVILTGGNDGIITEQGITIDKDLTIQGDAGLPQVIVQAAENPGEATERVFEVVEDVTVTIDNLTIRHGVDLSGNGGGGILNNGTLMLSNSNLLLNATTESGGGIKNSQGIVMLMGSTLGNNTANMSAEMGGGIFNSGGTLIVTNSTLSQNMAGSGGGIGTMGGSVTNLNSTITGNVSGEMGGGIFFTSDTQFTLQSTIVAGNMSGGGMNDMPSDIAGMDAAGSTGASVMNAQNNLIGDAASSGGIKHGVNGNIVGNGGIGTIDINTVLDVLLKNNGGVTLTHALVKGSPAIDAGINPNNLEFDQRGPGFPRVIRRSADIGAFESIFLGPAFEPAVAFGSGGRIEAEVVVSNLVLDQVFSLFPYAGFLGGVRVAIGDVNGDSVNDLITAPGPGGGPHVKVFEGETGREIASFMAYDPRFTGGVFVAAADVGGGANGMPDGFADIITGADAGGGPHVKVFSGADGSLLFNFFAYNPAFRGGVRVAAGLINGDDIPDIITGAGPGGGPHVRVFNGSDSLAAAMGIDIQSFFAFAPNYTGGVFVAANNTGGGQSSLIVVSSGTSLHTGARVALFNRPGGNATFDLPTSAGARVAVLDFNQDGTNDYLTATGPGSSGLVQLIDGNPGNPPLPPFDNGEPFGPTLLSFFPFGTLYQDGIFVAGSI